MEVIEVEIPYKYSERLHLYVKTDSHDGTKHCAYPMWRKINKIIKNDPFARWIHLGDKAECITQKDPRWDAEIVSDWVKPNDIAMSQCKHYCEMEEDIQDTCEGLLEGNHEDGIRIHNHDDIQNWICERLKVPNLGYSCFIRFKFQRRNSNEAHEVIGFFTHGSGWAITKGTKLNQLHRLMNNFEADIYGMGHVHDIITDTKPRLGLSSKNKIKHKVSVGAICGCLFTTYSQGIRCSYGEKRNYPPTTLGCVMFTIAPWKGIIDVEAIKP